MPCVGFVLLGTVAGGVDTKLLSSKPKENSEHTEFTLLHDMIKKDKPEPGMGLTAQVRIELAEFEVVEKWLLFSELFHKDKGDRQAQINYAYEDLKSAAIDILAWQKVLAFQDSSLSF